MLESLHEGFIESFNPNLLSMAQSFIGNRKQHVAMKSHNLYTIIMKIN